MDANLAVLLERAFAAYVDIRKDRALGPDVPYLSYDFKHWNVPSLGGAMVKDQLNELTNILNGWKSALKRWHAWNLTLEGFPDVNEAWDIRIEFVQPLVHVCLLHPSAVRDTMLFVATNSIHQIRLATEAGYRDHLHGDPTPAKPKGRFLNRPDKEARLCNLIAALPETSAFISALQAIDGDEYEQATSDYRNRWSHAIGPRLELGHVETVTRDVVPLTKLVKNEQNTFDEVTVQGQMAVSYGHGGIAPLNSEHARVANTVEFMKARQCYDLYRKLLVSAGIERFAFRPDS